MILDLRNFSQHTKQPLYSRKVYAVWCNGKKPFLIHFPFTLWATMKLFIMSLSPYMQESSGWSNAHHGVPRGSILGPEALNMFFRPISSSLLAGHCSSWFTHDVISLMWISDYLIVDMLLMTFYLPRIVRAFVHILQILKYPSKPGTDNSLVLKR